MSYTVTAGAIAIYITPDGDIIAAEKVLENRAIDENLLRAPPVPRVPGSEILKVEVSVDMQAVGATCCDGSRKFTMLRQCYDRNGRPCPCF